jgi:exopolysaccharide biosynthesis polyprenyl glycosylphosphotransferase
MNHIRRHILVEAFKLFDVSLFVAAFGLATLPVVHEARIYRLAEFLSMRVKIRNLALFIGFLILWHIIFKVVGLYESKRLAGRLAEIRDVLKATLLGTAFLGVSAQLFGVQMVDTLFLVYFLAISSTLTVASRLILRSALGGVRRRNRNLRHMLVVGSNSRALQFIRKIQARPELGYHVIGFADEAWPGMQGFLRTGYRKVCDLESLPAFLRSSVVDEVIMGLPLKSRYLQASQVAALCEEQGILVRFPSSIFDLKLARMRAEEFDGDSLITLLTGGMSESGPTVIKRAMDVVASTFLILLLSPVLLLVAALIKLTSPGPVFFVQKRMGVNKRIFAMCKFRTMVPDAERRMADIAHLNEVSGPVFKIKNDPRITSIGRLLRKTSIDELPQLFNVWKGDMSLVGPRPLPVRDYEGFDQDWQRRRFSVRPGITCLWQVAGRSSISFEKWMELDMEYIDQWSIWLDLQILARTIPAVLRGTGAA